MSNFNKYFQVQSRKMISAYGGVGSIVETTKGAIIIQDFDKWYFFLSDLHKGDDYRIDDFRLLQRLKYHFPNLSALIRIPANTESPNAYSVPQDEKKIASGKYFPEWFYCNNCESFKHIKDWWTDWKTDLQRFGYTNDRAKESFRPPKCNECFKKAKAHGGKKLYFELEQVRFIMTAPNGEICDIPWERWITAEKGIKEDDSHSGSIKVDYDNLCCDNPKLKYLKSSTFEDYSGIRIKCANCKKENSLAGLFGFRKSFFGDKSILFKPVIRTSNSVYYPVIINSIYLPAKKD